MAKMVKCRMKDAELPLRRSPHSFRVTTITDPLSQAVPLEDVQLLELAFLLPSYSNDFDFGKVFASQPARLRDATEV